MSDFDNRPYLKPKVSANDGSVAREIDRLNMVVPWQTEASDEAYLSAYVARQALCWALDPTNYRSPYDMIMKVPVQPCREPSVPCE